MGMYTELVMACRLKDDVPEDVIKILQYMCGEKVDDLKIPTDHEFFSYELWPMLNADSYYFVGQTHSMIRKVHELIGWRLTVRTNIKNYHDEIEKFLDWLNPYMKYYDPIEFLGYIRYEEDVFPTLIYLDNGKLHFKQGAF
jgi:hypothetical protein